MIRRRELGLLIGKEVRQLLRSRNAVISGIFFPLLMLVLVPGIQLLTVASTSTRSRGGTGGAGPLPGLGGVTDASHVFLYLVFPFFYLMCGLLTPTIAAIYTVISEREQRSLELLMALPVTVREILTAKLAANLAASGATILPFFVVNATLVLVVAHGGPLYVLAALLLLVCSLACSMGISLLLALVARDIRTANNLSGFAIFPSLAFAAASILLVPGLLRFVVLSALLLLLAAALFGFCLRWLTFERYLN